MNVAAGAYLDAVREAFRLGTVGEQLVSSAATLTDALTMLTAGTFLLDRWGRRLTVVIGAVSNVAGCLLGYNAASFGSLVASRLVQGIGNGIAILAVPMLVAESAPLRFRGFLVTFFQLGVVVGFTIPYIVQLVWDDWHLTIGAGGLPGLALLGLVASIWPHAESRAWLASRKLGAVDLALERPTEPEPGALEQLVGTPDHSRRTASAPAEVTAHGPDQAGQAQQAGQPHQARQEQGAAEAEGQSSQLTRRGRVAGSSRRDQPPIPPVDGHRPQGDTLPGPGPAHGRLDRLPRFSVAAVLAVVLAFTNNASDAIVFYGPQIMERAGIGGQKSLVTALALSGINVPAAGAVLLLIHRLPRRTLLLGGLGTIVGCYIALGVAFLSGADQHYAAVVVLFVCMMSAYQAGPGTLFVVVLPELFAQDRRASGMALGTAAMSAFSVLCNGTMLSTIAALGPGPTFLAYGGAYALCLAALARHLPESRAVRIA